MSLPKSPEVARVFGLAKELQSLDHLRPPVWATPKLNGVRAMWVRNLGFFSKDGIPYDAGILPHIETALQNCGEWLDGELYCHGMSLQQINARAGVVRRTPHSNHSVIRFHVFDGPMLVGAFDDRMNRLKVILQGRPFVELVPFRDCPCKDKARAAHEAFVSMGYEGTVYKDRGHYRMGPSNMMLKWKAWHDEDYEVLELIEGEGKHMHTLGAVSCRAPNGQEFKIGAFEFDDDERMAAWTQRPRPTRAKVKFMTLSDRGVPHCGRILALY